MFEKKSLRDDPDCTKQVARMIEEASVDIQVDPVLQKACAIDPVKFCRDIPRGEGRLFGCLVAVSDEARFSMEPRCKEKVM